MPIHDWTRVDAGIFHDFHYAWIAELRRVLNSGLLPADYYAMAEQVVGGPEPDVVTLQAPANGHPVASGAAGGVALAATEPKVWLRKRTEEDIYAGKANRIAVRHRSHHRVVAVLEIVSPGNKSSRYAIESFVEKAAQFLRAGIHLLIVDLFPPGPRDPQGLHKMIWDWFVEEEFALPADRPLTLVSYIGGAGKEAFVEPVAVGAPLTDMPLFLTQQTYVPVPLEATYQATWATVPAFWRDVLTQGTA